MSTGLHWAALIFYLLGTGLYLAFVWSQKRTLHMVGQAVLWVGVSLHTLALGAAWIEIGWPPVVTLRQSLDVFSWAFMGAMLLINLRLKVMILGAIIAPLCSLLLLSASVLPPPGSGTPELMKSVWVIAHVVTMLFGYGLLALTFLGGLLYLIQDAQIRAKKMGPLFKRLPPLNRLDQLNGQALVAGFILLTLGLITGAAYAQIALGSYWRWDPKEVWALITWLLYAGLLHVRLVQGWRGRRGAWLAALAFGALSFTFLGAGIWLSGYHNFGSLTNLTGMTP